MNENQQPHRITEERRSIKDGNWRASRDTFSKLRNTNIENYLRTWNTTPKKKEHFQKPSQKNVNVLLIVDRWFSWLLIVHSRLLIDDCWLLIDDVDWWLLIDDVDWWCWLMIVDCWLFFVDCWFLIVDCWLLIVDCCVFYVVCCMLIVNC